MNHRTHSMLAVLLGLTSLSVLAAPATESNSQAPTATTNNAAPRALSVANLTAIRVIGRNILAAKKSGSQDDADTAQLASLRSTLDALIDADLDPKIRGQIAVQTDDATEQRKARDKFASLREKTRSDARALSAQIRNRGELAAAQARSQPDQEARSAGLPIGEQRARMFVRWTQKLDSALAEGDEDRVGKLFELREQLNATLGSLKQAPATHGTPTLQAMPAGYVPPKKSGSNAEAKE